MTTAALTPPECDLQDFPRMMIDIPRLFASEFDATASDTEWRCGVTLWLKSFHQVPAASLPDDDAQLARLCGLGRDVKTWRRIRAGALRGWVLAVDGRLYHPFVAEIALEAWLEKLAQRLSSGAGNAARWGIEFDPEPIKAEIGATAALLADLNPKSKALAKQQVAQSLRKSRRETPSEVPTGRPEIPSGSQGKGREGKEPPLPPEGVGELFGEEPEPDPPDEVEEAFRLWNETARRCGLPVAKTLDDGRRRAIRKRLADGGLEAWRAALDAVQRSRHCRGENDRGWKADLDFVCQPKSWRRLLEGSYGDDAPAPPTEAGGPTATPNPWRQRVRAFVMNAYWEREFGPKPGMAGCKADPEILREFKIEPAPPQPIAGAA